KSLRSLRTASSSSSTRRAVMAGKGLSQQGQGNGEITRIGFDDGRGLRQQLVASLDVGQPDFGRLKPAGAGGLVLQVVAHPQAALLSSGNVDVQRPAGQDNVVFHRVLDQQLERERRQPVLPVLRAHIDGEVQARPVARAQQHAIEQRGLHERGGMVPVGIAHEQVAEEHQKPRHRQHINPAGAVAGPGRE
nr:hypothetical protein [Tanacetum cinerariifolium]